MARDLTLVPLILWRTLEFGEAENVVEGDRMRIAKRVKLPGNCRLNDKKQKVSVSIVVNSLSKRDR